MAQRQSGSRFFSSPGTKTEREHKVHFKKSNFKVDYGFEQYLHEASEASERTTYMKSLEYLLDFYDVLELTEEENGKRCCFITIMWMFCHLFSSTICYGIFKSFNSSPDCFHKRDFFYCWHGRKFVNSRGINKRRVQMSNACATNGTWKETNALSECTFLLLELLEILLLC